MSNLYRCFLPNFRSIGFAVSEEKIKMGKVNGRRTPSDGELKNGFKNKNWMKNEKKLKFEISLF